MPHMGVSFRTMEGDTRMGEGVKRQSTAVPRWGLEINRYTRDALIKISGEDPISSQCGNELSGGPTSIKTSLEI